MGFSALFTWACVSYVGEEMEEDEDEDEAGGARVVWLKVW